MPAVGRLWPSGDDDGDGDGGDGDMEVELAKQLDELYVVFGLRCLSVLRYLTDHIGVLSLGVLARSFSKFAQKLSTFV